jgi:hypothetical protein
VHVTEWHANEAGRDSRPIDLHGVKRRGQGWR